ncbi:MAG TPA: terminase gpA endonuclease subunit [Pelagibacterium sp.]|uniref:phage terminase large subunit family protein n=1 Tax=Pelagibacterium sp. TaxID=1967288 RepID=UPI002C3A6590|nr:terminase gpA endonuclease subunit [Pelagibacterium sp.]HWJ89319.1 terminase gpA endonuclease subunit [Pelagibacterium sp.]
MTSDLHATSERVIRAAGRVVFRGAASGILPDPREKVSEWAQKHRIVPEMGSKPGPWRNETAPYLVEIMDCLSPDHPCEQVVNMKCSQSGGSAVAENWIGFVMHRTPGPMMYVQATVKAAKDWHQEKLQPTIEATPVLDPKRGGAVIPQKSRSGEGSTSERIRFRGGFMNLAGANSAASLRQHSIRYMVRDDRSAWTDNADGEGDPKDLSDARLKTYRIFGMSKVYDVSTPKFEGADIDADYQRSDMRRFYMACKKCGALTDLVFEDLVRNEVAPYRSHFLCPECGEAHFEHDKPEMIAAGAWIPTRPDPETGEVPPKTIPAAEIEVWRTRDTGVHLIVGFVITGEMSIFERWDNLVAREKEAGDDPAKLQPFQNSDLGRPYKPKTDVPDWESLSSRREGDWQRGVAPAGVLYVTLTVDVQGDGMYWAFLGWGPNKQVWHLDAGFCAGTTDVAFEGAWPKLDAIADRGIDFAGVRVAADMIGVDSGYNSEPVYAWVKRRHNALALKGEDGWTKLPISRAQSAEIRKTGLSAGKAKKFGIKVWLVGTWGIKGALMHYLGRLPKEGETGFPVGYQHYPADAEEEYFRQLVSEYVMTEEVNGEKRRRWKARYANHWLDCNVYGWALTHFVGLWNWDESQWEKRARELAEMTASAERDLFGPSVAAVPGVVPVEPATEAPARSVGCGPKDDGLGALAKLNR